MQTKAQRTRLALLTFRLLWLFLKLRVRSVGVLPFSTIFFFFFAFDQAQEIKVSWSGDKVGNLPLNLCLGMQKKLLNK